MQVIYKCIDLTEAQINMYILVCTDKIKYQQKYNKKLVNTKRNESTVTCQMEGVINILLSSIYCYWTQKQYFIKIQSKCLNFQFKL